MSEPRPIRDIIAEGIRRERLGLMRPLWPHLGDEGQEQWRLRADHLMRLLESMGVQIVQTGEPAPALPPHQSPVIWRYTLADRDAERLVRRGPGDEWQIVTDGTVEQRFTLAEAHKNAGLVLIDAPEARQIPGLGRRLAALSEIYRTGAEAMGPVEQVKEAANG